MDQIQQTLLEEIAVSLTVMLLHITHLGIFPDKETMDAAVLACRIASVVDSAACYNGNVAILSDMKIIVYAFL